MPGKRFKNIQNYINDTAVVASFDGDTINIEGIENWSIQTDWTITTASFVGVIQTSNNGVAWQTTGNPLVLSSTGGDFQNFNNSFVKFARLTIIRISGTLDTIQSHVHLKSNN